MNGTERSVPFISVQQISMRAQPHHFDKYDVRLEEPDEFYNSRSWAHTHLAPRLVSYAVLNPIFVQVFTDATETHSDDEVVLFINLADIFRSLCSERAVASISRSQANRDPWDIATLVFTLVAHYRHYFYTRWGRSTSVFLYFSTERCESKIAKYPEYKQELFSRQISGSTEHAVIQSHIAKNLKVISTVAKYVPGVYAIDSQGIDSHLVPSIVSPMTNATSVKVVLTNSLADAQLALDGIVVINPNAAYTKSIVSRTLLPTLLSESKHVSELSIGLSPRHFLYALAMTGDEKLSVQGIPRFGLAKAASFILKLVKQGMLQANVPTLNTLLEECKWTPDQEVVVTSAWRQLVYSDQVQVLSETDLLPIYNSLETGSALHQLETVSASIFNNNVRLEMLLAGETGIG